MAGEKQQPTFVEEPKIPTDDKTPTCPVPNPPESKTWPELVGLPAEEVVKKIKEDIPGIRILMVPPNITTKDLDWIGFFYMLIVKEKLNAYPGLANGPHVPCT